MIAYSNVDYVIDLLQESGYITSADVAQAVGDLQPGETALEALVRQKVVDEVMIAQAVAVGASMEFVDLARIGPIPDEAIAAIRVEDARRYRVMPVGIDRGRLKIAVTDPLDFETLDALPFVVNGYELETVCGTLDQIHRLHTQYFGDADAAVRAMEKKIGIGMISSDDAGGGEVSTEEGPIIKMVSHTLIEAFQNRASDIHIEPLEGELRIRYRIDGVLHRIADHPRKLHNAIVSRIKIMTGTMNIDEKRMPQDGRIQVNQGDKQLDLRVSTVPTSHGESIVMRILDKSSLALGLPELGFFSDDQETFENLLGLPDGIILVTGPTGSGKTTTLYACLNFINKPDKKIITVEDPVEYELQGINQVMVKEEIGMTFAAALRSILRQAPNIVMIGEIRDKETAEIAIQASLTGHLVFSTLHTNDAPSAVARLTDIGVKPFLTASSVRAVLAQRLVRRLCAACKEPGILEEKEMRALNIDTEQLLDATIMGPVGCEKCRGTGFRGRLGIVEIFKIVDEVRQMINEEISTPQLRVRARELGMRTLREDGIRKALAGVTTAKEVLHSTMSDAS